jgi:hypothetical protein
VLSKGKVLYVKQRDAKDMLIWDKQDSDDGGIGCFDLAVGVMMGT